MSRKGDKITFFTLTFAHFVKVEIINSDGNLRLILLKEQWAHQVYKIIKSMQFNAAASLLLCVLAQCAGNITCMYSKDVTVNLLSSAKSRLRICSV